ncbi:twin-arginine translocation signal domain-containing protein, partial [Pseudomonas sp. NPDC089530]|uniref:twin-arginine translocation signal domain-containing protein n=1 Tax=Pseudomonas sp. NPDC089530 TaxID=3390651 RepID=UPI003D00AD2C
MNTLLNRRGFLAASSLAVGALGLSSLGLATRAFAQGDNLADLTLGVATYRGQDSYFVDDAG